MVGKQVVWMPSAIRHYHQVIGYLDDNWGRQVSKKFMSTVRRRLKILETNPFMGKRSDKVSSVRKLLLTKHNMLCYEVTVTRLIF